MTDDYETCDKVFYLFTFSSFRSVLTIFLGLQTPFKALAKKNKKEKKKKKGRRKKASVLRLTR